MAINSLSSLNQAYMRRISGMNSGLDTDTLIKNMMRVQQAKYDRMYQSKIRDEWKREAYTEINNALRKFKDEYASFLSANNMLDSSVYKSFVVEMASNPNLSVTAGIGAREGSYTVKILNTASGSKITGAEASDDVQGFSVSQLRDRKIESLTFAGGQTVSGNIEFTINGESFAFKSTDSLQSIMDKVNASDAGVVMSYSQLTNKFVLETKATGSMEGADILNVTDGDGGLLDLLGLTGAAEGPKQAELVINGTTVLRDTNNFEIDGISYRLNQTTESGSVISFGVKRDTQSSVDAVEKLVNAYNTLITSLYSSLTEKKSYGYAPLTDEQREGLTEKEAELWDTKSKAGLLNRDMELQKLLDGLQNALSTTIGDMGTLSSVGISLSGYRPGQPSLIQLDKVELQQALETDPDKVYNMFTSRVLDANGKFQAQASGLMPRITEMMDTFTVNTRDSVGSSINNLDNSIRAWDERMAAESKRLYQLQESYYKKFTALETALAKMQAQSNSLGLMGGYVAE